MDMHSGYHQLGIAKNDVEKTAFATPDGLFEWTMVPFGLANAPSFFMRLMTNLLRKHINGRYCLVYLDDVLVYTAPQAGESQAKTYQRHRQHLEGVIRSIDEAGLKLKPEKCQFGVNETTFLGYIVDTDGIHMEDGKVTAIRDWPAPKNGRDLAGFLGLANFYRRFIEKFAVKASPLYNIVSLRATEFRKQWSTAMQQAFEKVKEALCADSVVIAPEPGNSEPQTTTRRSTQPD